MCFLSAVYPFFSLMKWVCLFLLSLCSLSVIIVGGALFPLNRYGILQFRSYPLLPPPTFVFLSPVCFSVFCSAFPPPVLCAVCVGCLYWPKVKEFKPKKERERENLF
jgi:hypothetical protein